MSGLSCGIVGLPNVGKSTLFNALTKKGASAQNFPFCTIDPNVGIVDVDDPRLAVLSKLSKSQKIIPAAMTFVDIAGLVKGAAQGEGLGNKFLANIRETDAILHVVRCFEDDEVIHVEGKVDPISDIEVINLELILADIQMLDNILSKLERQAKGDKKLVPTVEVLKKAQAHLNDNKPIRTLTLTNEERLHLTPYHFLTQKKVIYACNVAEEDIISGNDHVNAVKAHAKQDGSDTITISAKIEEELATLAPEESLEYLQTLGLEETGLNRLIKTSFQTLGLLTYMTTGELETRAWTIKQGASAQEAAGEIHSDIQKGFIRAEVVTYDDMVEYGSRNAVKEAGKARSEGKEYTVCDGDVIIFFHH